MDSQKVARSTLTYREKEILVFLTEGKSTKDIAATCYIAEGTVKQHLNNIYRKLGVSSRLEAAMLFVNTT